jgi:hypothetical protein
MECIGTNKVKILYVVVGWIYLLQDWGQCWALARTVMNFRAEFLVQLRDYQLFTKSSVAWSWFLSFFWSNSSQCATTTSFTRFLDHTQRRTTVGRTLRDEWSARRRDLYLTTHNTTPVGIQTQAAAELRLRPRGYWDQHGVGWLISWGHLSYWVELIRSLSQLHTNTWLQNQIPSPKCCVWNNLMIWSFLPQWTHLLTNAIVQHVGRTYLLPHTTLQQAGHVRCHSLFFNKLDMFTLTHDSEKYLNQTYHH